jgi:hypothetical protein
MSEWISTKQRLPEDDDNVLVYYLNICEHTDAVEVIIETGRYLVNHWVQLQGQNVLYWMPLPEPPEQTADKKIILWLDKGEFSSLSDTIPAIDRVSDSKIDEKGLYNLILDFKFNEDGRQAWTFIAILDPMQIVLQT